jgi:hypothetical protein
MDKNVRIWGFHNDATLNVDYFAKHIRQNSSLQEGQSLYLAGLFSNPERVKMLNQNGMLDCTVVWQAHKKRRIPA